MRREETLLSVREAGWDHRSTVTLIPGSRNGAGDSVKQIDGEYCDYRIGRRDRRDLTQSSCLSRTVCEQHCS